MTAAAGNAAPQPYTSAHAMTGAVTQKTGSVWAPRSTADSSCSGRVATMAAAATSRSTVSSGQRRAAGRWYRTKVSAVQPPSPASTSQPAATCR